MTDEILIDPDAACERSLQIWQGSPAGELGGKREWFEAGHRAGRNRRREQWLEEGLSASKAEVERLEKLARGSQVAIATAMVATIRAALSLGLSGEEACRIAELNFGLPVTAEPSPPTNPDSIFIWEEQELGGGYHTRLVAPCGPERDWSPPYKKTGVTFYRNRVVRYEPAHHPKGAPMISQIATSPSAPTAFDIAVTERFDAWYSRLLIEKKGLVGPMDFVKFGGEVQSELDRAAIDEAANDERLRSKRQ